MADKNIAFAQGVRSARLNAATVATLRALTTDNEFGKYEIRADWTLPAFARVRARWPSLVARKTDITVSCDEVPAAYMCGTPSPEDKVHAYRG